MEGLEAFGSEAYAACAREHVEDKALEALPEPPPAPYPVPQPQPPPQPRWAAAAGSYETRDLTVAPRKNLTPRVGRRRRPPLRSEA